MTMQTQRSGSVLKIHIRLAAQSLGRDGGTKGMSISALKERLAELRREQIERGIIKGENR